jgi:hypothetical protein
MILCRQHIGGISYSIKTGLRQLLVSLKFSSFSKPFLDLLVDQSLTSSPFLFDAR